MRDIESQARAIVLRAQQQAEQVLAEAQQHGQRIRQEAYDKGFAAGREDGLRRGTEDGKAAGRHQALAEHRAKLDELIKTLTAAVAEIDAARSRLESVAAAEVVKLAVAIARRATKLLGELNSSVLSENVKAAMKLAIHSTDVRIAVHPTQKQALAEVLPQLKLQWPKLSHVELVDDAALSPGGCRIFTASGQIDGDLQTQIDRVAADLLSGQEAPA